MELNSDDLDLGYDNLDLGCDDLGYGGRVLLDAIGPPGSISLLSISLLYFFRSQKAALWRASPDTSPGGECQARLLRRVT